MLPPRSEKCISGNWTGYLLAARTHCTLARLLQKLYQAETDRHEDHVAGLIRRVPHISPCISFYVLSHRDVDWVLLSLVMRSDRCTWLASCYVTHHIRFHWQEIRIRKWRFLPSTTGAWREDLSLSFSRRKEFYILSVKTDIRRVSLLVFFYC